MKTMTVSPIVFRPNPAHPTEGRVELGHLVEVVDRAGDGDWSITMFLRGDELEDELKGVDSLTHAIVKNLEAVLSAEINKVLEQSPRPGELLNRLAACTNSSVGLEPPVQHKGSKAAAEAKTWLETAAKHAARRRSASDGARAPVGAHYVGVASKSVRLQLAELAY